MITRPLFMTFALCGFLFAAPALAEKPQVEKPQTAQQQGKILDVKTFKTKSGVEVWLVSDKTVPVISMDFSFEGGLVNDPEGKPGVARLVSIMLDEGAGNIRSQEFQAKLSDNAIQLGFTAGRDAFYGQLRTLKEHRELAFELLQLALAHPRFDADAIERMRNANVAQIQHDLGDPAWLVARAFNGMVFEGHPYGLPGAGHLASMAAITRQDLVDYTASQFVRSGLKLAIAGDITEDEAARLVDKAFGALPAEGESEKSGFFLPKYTGKTILFPLNTPQTQINIGAAGIPRDDKDWHAAVIMNYILGGGSFDARLMREIREKRGLTYGIYSSLQSMRQTALLTAGFAASNEKAKEAIDVLKDEWKRMAEEGATEVEITDAKAYLTGSLLLELTSTGDISSTLNGLQRDGLDADYINRRNAELMKVTPDDVKRVAQRLLKADELTIVMVGKPEGIKPDILLDRPPGMKEPEKK